APVTARNARRTPVQPREEREPRLVVLRRFREHVAPELLASVRDAQEPRLVAGGETAQRMLHRQRDRVEDAEQRVAPVAERDAPRPDRRRAAAERLAAAAWRGRRITAEDHAAEVEVVAREHDLLARQQFAARADLEV